MGISLKIRYFVNWMIPPWFPLADADIIRYSVYNCVCNFRAVSELQTGYGTFMRINTGTRYRFNNQKKKCSSILPARSYIIMFYKCKCFFFSIPRLQTLFFSISKQFFKYTIKLNKIKGAIVKYRTKLKLLLSHRWIKFYFQYISNFGKRMQMQ